MKRYLEAIIEAKNGNRTKAIELLKEALLINPSDLEVIEEIPWDTDCDVIGIGGVGHAARRAKDIAIEFNKRGKIVFMGGPMVSLIPEVAKEYCDSVMIGDSELTIQELCQADLQGKLLSRFSITFLMIFFFLLMNPT